MARKCATGTTGMIAVHLGAEEVEKVFSSMRLPALLVACYNGPADCVVAGPLKDLRAFKLFLDSHFQCETMFLQVPFGYHSSAMDPVLDDLSIAARGVTTRAPSIPIASNVSGELVFPGDKTHFNPSYFARHCVKPVQFYNSVASLLSKFNIDVWIEVGPHATVLPMLKFNPLIQRNALLLPSLHKRHDAWHSLTSSLSSLYMSGISVLWRVVFSHVEAISCTSLPSYPFTRSKFWVPYRERGVSRERKASVLECSLLRSFTQHPCPENGFVSLFETPVRQLAPYITGHCVGGVPLCPASVYIEQVFAGIELSMRYLGISSSRNGPILREIKFPSPLVYNEDIDRTIIITIRVGEETGSFDVASQTDVSEKVVYAQGQYRLQSSDRTMSKFARLQPIVDRMLASVLRPQPGSEPEMFSRRTVYDVIFPRVVRYSKEYQTIKSMFVGADGMEGYAEFAIQAPRREDMFNPIFMDTLLHVPGFVANMKCDENDIYICSEVGSLKVLPEQIKHDASYAVYCSNVSLPEQNVIITDAYAVSTSEPKKIVAYIKGTHFRRIRLKSFVKCLHMNGSGHISQPGGPERMNLSLVTDKLYLSERKIQTKLSNVSDMTSSITALVAAACNIDQSNVKTNGDFSFLGVDSLMSIEIAKGLQNMFPETKLDVRDLCRCRTVEQLVDEIRVTMLTPVASTTVTRSASGASSPRTLVFDDGLLDYPNSHASANEGCNIREIISSVLGININDIRDDHELQLLGLDSLTTIEALHEIRKQFNSDVPSNLFVICRTVRALQDYFDIHSRANKKHVEFESGSSFNALPGLRLDMIPCPLQVPNIPSDRTLLILIHDGSGLTTYYGRLTSLDRSVWAINNPHFETADPWDSISKMAGYYADRVRCLEQPSVILGGKYSMVTLDIDAESQVLRLVFRRSGCLRNVSPTSSQRCRRQRYPAYRRPGPIHSCAPI